MILKDFLFLCGPSFRSVLKRFLGLLVNGFDSVKTQFPAFLPGVGVEGSIVSGDET